MLDAAPHSLPPSLHDIEAETQAIGFTMGSDHLTGALLRALAASKPSARALELGTGTGLATAWLLDGMDARSTLLTVDRDAHAPAIAQRFLGADPRLTFVTANAPTFIADAGQRGDIFDLIFADMAPGKFELLDETLRLLASGGLYVVDDLLPLPEWSPEHSVKVRALITTLESNPALRVIKLDWSSGLLIAARISRSVNV